MSIDALIMFSGALVAVLPFLGFPNSWDKAILFVVGMVIVGLGVLVRRNAHRALFAKHAMKRRAESFVETSPEEVAEPLENRPVHEEVA